MFSKLLNAPIIPEFSMKEIELLTNAMLAIFPEDNSNVSYDDFVNSINTIFQSEIAKHAPTTDPFFGRVVYDPPEREAKRKILQGWQDVILASVEGKKNSTISLNDVNGTFYDALKSLFLGVNPEAYRYLCLSTIREGLNNKEWMQIIDLHTSDPKHLPVTVASDVERSSFVIGQVARAKTDEELEQQLEKGSLSFWIRYGRSKKFIEDNTFMNQNLRPLEKLAFESIFRFGELKVRNELEERFKTKMGAWTDISEKMMTALNYTKLQSQTFIQIYSELFSGSEDLNEIADIAAEKIKDLTKETQLPEVDTGLEGFFESVAAQMREVTVEAVTQKIDETIETVSKTMDETFDTVTKAMDEANEAINEGIDTVIEVIAEAPTQIGKKVEEVRNEVVETINKPEPPYEPFFTQDPKYVWNYRVDVIDQEQTFLLASDQTERIANLKAYFEDRIEEISKLEDDSYTAFIAKFAEELRGLSISETIKAGLSEESVDFENLNLHLRFALPFNLLKESLSEGLDAEGQRRVNELSSLIMESTANAFNKWASGEEELVSKQPSLSQIDYVLAQMQKASAYLSTAFQDKLDHTIETLNARQLYFDQTEEELNDLEEDLNNHENYLAQMEEELEAELDNTDEANNKREQIDTDREAIATTRETLPIARKQLEDERKQFNAERAQMLTEIEDYPSTVEYGAGWEFTASLLHTDSGSLQMSYSEQTQDKAEEEQRKLVEEQRKLAEEQLAEEQLAEEQEKQRKQEARQQELAAWQPKKNACLRLIDKEIKRLDEFSLFANDEITQERIIAFNTLRKKVELTKNIGQLCLELKNFENSTIPFIRENETEPRNRAISDILKSNRFSSKAEISEDTKSNKFFQSLKKRAMTDYVAQLGKKLSEEQEPRARKTLLDKIQELLREIAQIGKKKVPQLEVVEEVENPIQPQIVAEVENPVQSQVVEVPQKKKGPNPKDEKAVASYLTQELRAFSAENPEWFNTNRQIIPKKTVGILSAAKDFIGVNSDELRIIKTNQLLGECTERKINAIAKIVKEIQKLKEDKGVFSTHTPHQREAKIALLERFMNNLGWNPKQKPEFLPALIDDNVTVTGVRNKIFGDPTNKKESMMPAFTTLGFQKRSTFFGESALQTFVKKLPGEVKDPKPTEPKETMDLKI
ncbi:TPA: hypothetical protein ACRIDK_001294 [Legionella anisa]